MMTLNKVLTTAAMVGIASAIAFAGDAQKAPQEQKPTDSTSIPGCPGMGGKMGTGMMGKGMHGMMGSGAMGPGMMHSMPMGMGMIQPGMMMAGTPAMVEDRLGAIKTELSITDAQTDAWSAYASALKNRATVMQSTHEAMTQAMRSGTVIGRLDAHIQRMSAMLEAMKALKPATEDLYRVLNDEQKKKADTLLGAGCGMM